MSVPSAAEQHTIGPPAERRTWVEMVMGLPVSVTLRGPRARSERAGRAVRALYAVLHRADRTFSTYRAGSEISRLRSGALPRELASPDVRDVLELCTQANRLTGGCFDAQLPQPDGGRLLDPSGLVKGWAVERSARVLDSLDQLDWLVNAGGDVIGRACSGPAWRIAVEDPRDRTRLLCVVPLRSGAVATSGTAARGRHLIDPRTGQPAADHLLSATVVGPSLTWADVLATAAFVEGPHALVRVADFAGYQALLVLPDGRLTGTPGAAALLGAESRAGAAPPGWGGRRRRDPTTAAPPTAGSRTPG